MICNSVNGTDWKDTKGNPIAAHEGDIARFNGVFYWYGSSYANNPKGNPITLSIASLFSFFTKLIQTFFSARFDFSFTHNRSLFFGLNAVND